MDLKKIGSSAISRLPIFSSRNTLADLKKSVKYLKKELAMRPKIEDIMNRYNENAEVQIPRIPLRYENAYDTAESCSVLRSCILNIRQETFRRGYEILPLFESKCPSCGEEYESRDTDGKCDACGGKLRLADKEEEQKLTHFFKKVNFNDQSLLEVLNQFEDDLNIIDDAYLIVRKEYAQDASGHILMENPKEIIRASPIFMRIVSDPRGNLGGKWWICVAHRDKVSEYPGHCDCGMRLYPVHYISLKSQGSMNEPEEYFIKGEVLHCSKYRPTFLYGYSPVFTLWRMAFSLIRQEQWITEWYKSYRRPRQMLVASTKNRESLNASWDEMQQKVKNDPHYTPLLIIESETGKGAFEAVSLADSISEMQFIETRNEFRERIGQLYKVSPIFQGDVSTGGGLNNEGLQIVVTNRAVEDAQRIYHEKVFPWILKQFGILEWEIKLLPSEEKDEMADLQREYQKILNAQGMATLGFDVDQTPEGEFKYTKVTPSQQDELAAFPDVEQVIQTSGLPASPKTATKEIKKEFWSKAQEAIAASLWSNFKDLPKGIDKKVQKILIDHFKNKIETPMPELLSKLTALGLEKDQAETILRTEEAVVTNKARELSFLEREKRDGEEYKYKWTGPADKRTSKICREIKAKVGSGVGMERLKKIINETVKANAGKNPPGDFRTHPNCRHAINRVL